MTPIPQIVVIDDDREWIAILKEFLQRHGFAVQSAADPITGLALLERNGANLAIIDWHMPEMTGPDVVRRLRRKRTDVSVILMSSDVTPSRTAQALAAGALAFLTKTAPLALLRLLRKLLDRPVLALPPCRPWERLLPSPEYYSSRKRGS